MPLKEFTCLNCQKFFETLTTQDSVQCPQCQSFNLKTEISLFSIKNKQLDEPLWHGCHPAKSELESH